MAGEELEPDTPTGVRYSPARSVHISPLTRGVVSVERNSSRMSKTGRVAAAVAAFDSAPSSSKPATRSAGSSSIPVTPGISAGASSSGSASTAAPANGDQSKAQASSSSARLRRKAPAGIAVVSIVDESVQESDVDASQIDSPNKTAAKQSFPVLSAKKAAPVSPSKPYGKQNLSLRGSHAPGLSADGSTRSIDTSDHGLASRQEASWNTPKQTRGSSSGSSSGGAALPDVGRRLANSPVKSMNKTPPGMSREGSSSTSQASVHGSGGRVGSPSKMNRAGKISLRASKPAAHH